MDNIITHNFKNLLKNKIFFKISEISEEIVNSLIDNLFNFDNSHIDYFQFINRISEASRKIILATIAETFETIDTVFCDAPSRSEKYYINKSNVSRTITTIVGAQDQENDIMVKCFVTFESIKQVGKNRRALVNRYVFSTTGKNAWSKFMDHIAKRYDFSKIRHIYLLADGGNWIKNGLHELKLYAQNKPQFCLCEFHFKQAINHISSDKDERKNLLEIFNTKPFEEFKKRIDELIVINPNRKETITNKYNYIKNNKSAIKRKNIQIIFRKFLTPIHILPLKFIKSFLLFRFFIFN